MIYLSLSALKYAANICEEFPKYKIGIALQDISDSKSIIDIKNSIFRNSLIFQGLPPIKYQNLMYFPLFLPL